MVLDARIAHLGFIQGVINRMGQNSFLSKGWTVTLLAAMFALADKETRRDFVLIPLLTVAVFWLLDTYYLHQERLYRRLYEMVAAGEIASCRFILSPQALSSRPPRCGELDCDRPLPSAWRVFRSKTLLLFYGSLLAAVLFAMLLLLGG